MHSATVSLREATALPDAAELVATLRNQGYLKLDCDRGIREIIQGVFAAGDAFFSLPVDVKTRSALAAEMEGYRGFAAEYCDVEDRPDLCESFWCHAFNADSARRTFDASALPLYERLAAVAARFDAIVTDLTRSMEAFYWNVLSDTPQFRTNFGAHLQLNYYRPGPEQRDLLLDSHEDGLLFTILQSTAAGLEIRTKDGTFAPIQTTADELLVMPGDIAWLLSGGDFEPLYHRVRNRPDVTKRMSLMYFSNPNASRSRRLKPWRDSPVNQGTDIMQRVIDNPLKFGLPPIPVVDDGC